MFNGTIAAAVPGAGEVVVDAGSAGVLALTNSNNTYGGGTFLNSGTLNVNSDGRWARLPAPK